MPVSIDDSLSMFIEQRTRGQRKCQIWKELHKGRITSSLFGAVLTSGPSPTSLIKQVIHGSSLDRYNIKTLNAWKIQMNTIVHLNLTSKNLCHNVRYWNFLGIRHSLFQSGGELSMSRIPWWITWPSRTLLPVWEWRSLDSPYTHPMHFWELPVMDGCMMSPCQRKTRREFWRWSALTPSVMMSLHTERYGTLFL